MADEEGRTDDTEEGGQSNPVAVAYLLPFLLLVSAQLVRCVQFNTQFMAAEGPPGEAHQPNSVSDKGASGGGSGLAVELELSEITIRVVVGNKKSLESRPERD